MFFKTNKCKPNKMMIRLNNFLYVFNLRQGTILIAVHQIALSSFLLIIMLVGLSHVAEMLSMLHRDIEDNAERSGYYGDHQTFRKGDAGNTNNQKSFNKAKRLASATVIILTTCTVLTVIYLICSISLLHGALKQQRKYVLPWILASCIGVLILIFAVILGEEYPDVMNLFGGRRLYHFGCAVVVLTSMYAICAVSSYALETDGGRCAENTPASSDERGERLLLLDHTANSSLLSAAQLNKLSHGTSTTQFV